MKKRVYGSVYVTVYKDVEIVDSELEGLDQDEVKELFIERAYDGFGGITNFVGNGGTDKLIGVYGDGEGIYEDGEIEFREVEDE